MIAFGFKFRCVDPAQNALDDAVTMDATAGLGIAVKGDVGQDVTITRQAFCGREGG